MAYTVTADLQGVLSIKQAFDSTSLPGATGGGATLTHSAFNEAVTLSSSTVTITKCWVTSKAMSAGAATIDLTSLTDLTQTGTTLSGLKVQAVYFGNPSTNANAITITEGGTNGHALMGSAWKIILQPGQWIVWFGNEASQDVGASDLSWDISGTGSQALDIALVAG